MLRVAQTSPRSVIGQNDLDQPLSGRENIDSTLVMPFPVELLRFFSPHRAFLGALDAPLPFEL
ncbi:MAG: hypothetical protein ACRDPD_05495 [Streptosporangiaceae bacterium]